MPLKIQLRHDTAANWTSVNPVLMAGEAGIDTTANKIKLGDGVTAWNSLAYALTGPTGAQGPIGPPGLTLSGPALTIAAGVPLIMRMSGMDAYTGYSVTAATGQVSLEDDTITYVGQAIGTDTLTIHAGDASRELSITVIANSLSPAPEAPPAIGAALEGGYYAGAVWDTATSATGAFAVGTGAVTLTIQAPDLPKFYIGQPVRLAATDSRNGIMQGTVLSGSGDQLTLDITAYQGGNLGTSYSAWVVAVPWKIIVAPRASGENAGVMIKTANTSDPAACRTLTNGPAATAAMQALNVNPLNPVYPAAWWVSQINAAGGIGGYADWYLPARDELELLWRHFKPVTNNNYVTADRYNAGAYTRDANFSDQAQTHGANLNSYPAGAAYTASVPGQTGVASFQSGGAEALAFGSVYYWSCSEIASNFTWNQFYGASNPGGQYSLSKNLSYRVRAVRRSIL